MKKSFIALTLTLLLLVTLFTVPAFAEGEEPLEPSACTHECASSEEGCVLICHVHDENCLEYDDEGNLVYGNVLSCTKEEHTHSAFPSDCYACGVATHNHTAECKVLTCTKEEHVHRATCYDLNYICGETPCAEGQHTENCWECHHQHTDACYPVIEEPEQPANNGGTQYYPDYDEKPAAPAAPVVVDEAVSPKTGDPVSVAALVALMAAAAACVAFAARKVCG